MNRLLVALLAAFDAVLAAVIGVAAALAPLAVLWAFGMGGTARWSALWPSAVRVWQSGHLVPLRVDLPTDYLVAAGIADDAASFAFSLAPLAFAVFTASFAARSGVRAARAGAWPTGVLAGTAAFAAAAGLMTATSTNPVAAVSGWQAVLMPAVVFALPALGGALVAAWRDGDDGPVDRWRERVGRDARWRDVPAAIARGTAAALAGLVGVGALLVVVGLLVRGGEVVALFETAHVDLLGAIVLTLGQLAYLPTLIVWAAAFAAGPGFALGTGTSVSPAGTQVGVVPGVPILGIVPASTTPWLLLLALLVVGVGVVAGAAARARLLRTAGTVATGPRVVTALAVAVLSGLGAAALAWAAAGGIGPGRLQTTGPEAGPVALAVAGEIVLGAGALLFAARGARRERTDAEGPSRTDADGSSRTDADGPKPADAATAYPLDDAALAGRPTPLPDDGGEPGRR
ncbi:DUF6350 family protein [Microbacterium sp.]|uniref:cell division protein PerM n=1 Tax=Microbacterium sp. TaxID=51671 RepID=UPI0039E68D5D